jgi:exopolysaccharide biosynthesis polyprenyl glycosylphosphotransferase
VNTTCTILEIKDSKPGQLTLPGPRGAWPPVGVSTRSPLGNHKRLARADGTFAFAMALACVVIGNASQLPASKFSQFLEMHITVMNAAFAGLFILLWAVCFEFLGLYQSEHQRVVNKLARIAGGCAFMTAILALYLAVARTQRPISRIALFFFVSSIIYEVLRIFGGQWIAARDPQLVLILGSGNRAAKAWSEIRKHHHGIVKLVGFVDDRPSDEMAPGISAQYLGTIDDLNELLLRNVIDELVVAVPMKSCYDLAQRAVQIAETVGVRVVAMQDTYITTLRGGAPRKGELFSELMPAPDGYLTAQLVKRVVDIIGSLLGLIVLSPVFLVVAIAVKATSKGPVFFVQDRCGYRRRVFRMYKFRSMVSNAAEMMSQLETQNEASGPIFKIRRDPRITPLGRFLRVSSIDELPQLWNVLIGNMSLVGPRPMAVRDVLLFSEVTLMRRFTVKPGITGLWQVSGRSTLGFSKWIEMDFNYIDSWSLGLDFRILAKTVGAVIKGTGAI